MIILLHSCTDFLCYINIQKSLYRLFHVFITFLLCRIERGRGIQPKSRARIRSVLWAAGKEKFSKVLGNVYGISSILQVAEERYFRFVMRGELDASLPRRYENIDNLWKVRPCVPSTEFVETRRLSKLWVNRLSRLFDTRFLNLYFHNFFFDSRNIMISTTAIFLINSDHSLCKKFQTVLTRNKNFSSFSFLSRSL